MKLSTEVKIYGVFFAAAFTGVLIVVDGRCCAEDVLLDEASARLLPGLQAGPHVLFRISDIGSGIPPEIGDKFSIHFSRLKDRTEGQDSDSPP